MSDSSEERLRSHYDPEIRPVKGIKRDNDEAYSWLLPSIPKPNSRLTLVGCSMCGKSTVIENLIDRLWINPDGESVFDYVFIFSPTDKQDPIYERIESNPALKDKVYRSNKLDYELINKMLNREPDGNKICIYIDDFANDKKALSHPVITGLFMLGRHSNITPIICSQYYCNVPLQIRTNSTGILIFRPKRKNESDLLKFQLSTPIFHDEIFDDVMKIAHSKSQYDFLYIDLMSQKFYQNFKQEFVINKDGESVETGEELDASSIPEPKAEEEDKNDDIDAEIKKQIAEWKSSHAS